MNFELLTKSNKYWFYFIILYFVAVKFYRDLLTDLIYINLFYVLNF